ncbi:CBS domain-containing protein [Allosphingosinicella sp.]|uniref:CBS domain-containing protein n=1 Tax=Allosphingosinicella sp. TaxID=2823234 RepID=UPI002FC25B40
MKVSECMTSRVETVSPDQPISKAAQTMLSTDAGSMPVCEGGRVVGMLTDRDIAVRGVAKGLGSDTAVRDVMSSDILCCYDDQDVTEVADQMKESQVRRIPVMSRDEQLVGIVSLGDLSRSHANEAASRALEGVSEPGGEHNQSHAQAEVAY